MATRRNLEVASEKGEEVRPLKEKLVEHWKSRDFTVKEEDMKLNKTGISIFWFVLISLEIEVQYLLIPAALTGTNRLVMRIIAVYLFLIMAVFWSACRFNRQNDVRTDMKEDAIKQCDGNLLEGWHPCPQCLMDAPPRSHHCKLCKVCVLKRDHHCYFTGACVGLYTQGYFVFLCFMGSVSLAIGMALQLMYVNQVIPLFSQEFVCYLPIVNILLWLMGHVPAGIALILCHAYLCFACWATFTFYLFWQLRIVSEGKTSFEMWKSIRVHKAGTAIENFREVFGDICKIPVLFLWPTRRCLPTDGLTWR